MARLARLFRVAPAANDHHPAVRCALGVGVPLLILLALGHTGLAIFAVLGAFTGVYGRGEPHRPRLRQQVRAGGLLLLAVLAGELTALAGPPLWAIVIGTAIVAGLGFVASSSSRLRPEGSLFFVFAYGAVGFMSHPAPLGAAVLVAGLSVAFSVGMGSAGWLIPSHRTPWVAKPAPPLSAVERRVVYAEAWMHVAAVAVSGGIALAVGLGHSYWAMIAATVPLVGATAGHRIARGLQRLMGTLGGLVIAGVLLGLPMSDWQRVLAIIALQFLVELLITRNYALGQVFVTPLALMMTEVAHPTAPWILMRDRGVETVIGAAVGIALVAIVRRFIRQPAATL